MTTTPTATPNSSDLVYEGRKIDLEAGRRAFIRSLGLGAAGLAIMGASGGSASAQAAVDPADVFNFALNLEYLEAEFYLRALTGNGLPDDMISGNGDLGPVRGGRQVPFQNNPVRQLARELASDEMNHVRFLRNILGNRRIARPAIDFGRGFTLSARAAGLIGPNDEFDAFANENSFLIASFIFEDVGVTAYKGATPLIRNNEFLEDAAGILAVEAYHAGAIRYAMYLRGLFPQAQRVSDLRDTLDGPGERDLGIGDQNQSEFVPADSNSLTFSRTPRQVLAIVYGNVDVRPDGFFPNGTNGALR